MMGWGVNDYPDCQKEKPRHVCPICYQECDTLFLGNNDQVVGCDVCVKEVDADEYFSENYY